MAAIRAYQNRYNATYADGHGFKAGFDDGIVTATRESMLGEHFQFTTIVNLNRMFWINLSFSRLPAAYPAGPVFLLIRKAILERP
ncbi:hypothetical protein [Bosea sp. PAMC 26642]|uniref:hypothetical protein n=1 Tax=Bosea sp. (strain PAMC 26642) TaxID=1792307 RepID=UPI0012E8F7CD|nr:hypothetical protein [Bosea sp. PAMC 26642]